MSNKKITSIDEALRQKAITEFTFRHTQIHGLISSMLYKAKMMPIIDLVGHNPTFTEMVKELKEFFNHCCEMKLLLNSNSDLSTLGIYIDLTENLAIAIESQNYDEIGAAIAALDEKPYI